MRLQIYYLILSGGVGQHKYYDTYVVHILINVNLGMLECGYGCMPHFFVAI